MHACIIYIYIHTHSTVCIRYTYVHFHACLCLYPITCLVMSSCFQSSNPQNICWLIPRWIFAWILDLRNASKCQNWMGTSTENSIFDVILLVSCRFSQETIWCQKTMVSCKIFPHTRSQVTNPLREMHRRTSEIRCSPSWPSPLHTLVAWLVRWVSSCLNMVDLSPFLLILMVNMRVLVHSFFFLSLILRPNYMRVETNISTPIFFCKWEHRNT